MAINLDERYPGRANGKTLSYPQGSFKNRTSPTSKDGTYLEQDWANDQLAFFQSLLAKAGLTANGLVDTVQASQYFDALIDIVRETSLPVYETVPSSNVGPIIYVLQRQSILQWMTIGSWTGYASPRVGEVEFGWTPSPLPWQIDATGGVFNKTEYASLYARFQASGLLVPSASWVAGEYKICDVSSTEFRAPDLRDMFLRFTGTDADTANARAIGSRQNDALQNIAGTFRVRNIDGNQTVAGSLSGPFDRTSSTVNEIGASSGPNTQSTLVNFDASRVAKTATETRAVNAAMIARIYR